MLSTLGKTYRRLRRRLSRSHLVTRWLGYEVEKSESHEPGIIVLQVDGLSRRQFEAAVSGKRLPFLRKLIRRGYFRRMSFYSGIPSTTPAVQAEVMYGVKRAVPAFQFLHRKSGKVFRMFDHDAVKTIVEERLNGADPLLNCGASYSNIYSGGADEARCCVETTDVPNALAELNPFRLVSMFVLYFFTLLRITMLTGIEIVVGLWDMVRGLFGQRDWWNEIKFVPARVLVSIVLREWVRIAVKLSIAQGTPVIYANLLGYDEQSHRRGPSAAFAHWGLKGIDKAIEDIFTTARRSDARDYEVVVFSDHGQEETRIYEFETGQTIQDALRSSLEEGPLGHRIVQSLDSAKKGRNLDQRMRRLLRIRRGLVDAPQITEKDLAENVIVTAMGPIGHIYLPVEVPDDAKAACAEHLVEVGQVPLVVWRSGDGEVFARNERGLWTLPSDIAQVCGSNHRFAEQVAEDLIELTGDENAGDVIICGWDPELPPLTFVREHGAHGSIGSQETRGFALMPVKVQTDVRTAASSEQFIRGVDLHQAVKRFLQGTEDEREAASRTDKPANPIDDAEANHQSHRRHDTSSFRVVTYNTHNCVGIDGKCRPPRIADVLSNLNADVVALQEMDVNRRRSGEQDQTAMIASQLGMYHRFFPVWSSGTEQYGLSVLSRFPMSVVRQEILTDVDHRSRREARGAIWVSLDTDAGPVHFINTHLGLTRGERVKQIDELLGERWLNDLQTKEPVILAGDFNAGPKSHVMKRLTRFLHCAQSLAEDHRPQKTFASILPLRRIDHILVSRHFRVDEAVVPKDHATAVASDHLPVCAKVEVLNQSTVGTKPARDINHSVSEENLLNEVVSSGIS